MTKRISQNTVTTSTINPTEKARKNLLGTILKLSDAFEDFNKAVFESPLTSQETSEIFTACSATIESKLYFWSWYFAQKKMPREVLGMLFKLYEQSTKELKTWVKAQESQEHSELESKGHKLPKPIKEDSERIQFDWFELQGFLATFGATKAKIKKWLKLGLLPILISDEHDTATLLRQDWNEIIKILLDYEDIEEGLKEWQTRIN